MSHLGSKLFVCTFYSLATRMNKEPSLLCRSLGRTWQWITWWVKDTWESASLFKENQPWLGLYKIRIIHHYYYYNHYCFNLLCRITYKQFSFAPLVSLICPSLTLRAETRWGAGGTLAPGANWGQIVCRLTLAWIWEVGSGWTDPAELPSCIHTAGCSVRLHCRWSQGS